MIAPYADILDLQAQSMETDTVAIGGISQTGLHGRETPTLGSRFSLS